MKQIKIFSSCRSLTAALKVLIMILFLASCKHDDLTLVLPNQNARPAADFIKNNYELKLFYEAIKKVGYVDQLNGSGPFTILAPTDVAFNSIGIFSAADFDKLNQDTLKKLIGYHVLPRLLRTSAIPSNGVDVRYATLEGSELYATIASTNINGGAAGDYLYFNGANASRKDVDLANGTLYVLSKVMKPNFNNTTQRWLETHKEYAVFVKGLKKFGLWSQLVSGGPYTIFAPDDAALQKVGITGASLDAMDQTKYIGDRLFGAYILYGKHFFISDSGVFGLINSNGGYTYTLKNDTHVMSFGAFQTNIYQSYYYSLVLRSGSGILDPIVSSVTSDFYHKTDNLCSNGLVHHLANGMVRPEQALKN